MTLPPASDDSDAASQHSQDRIVDFFEWMHVRGRFLPEVRQASALNHIRYFHKLAEREDRLTWHAGLATAIRLQDLMEVAQPDPGEVAALVRIAQVNAFNGTGWNNMAVLIRAWAENNGYPTPRDFFDPESYRRRNLIRDIVAHFPELRGELERGAGRLDVQMNTLAEAVRAALKAGDPALPLRIILYLDTALRQLEGAPREPGVISEVKRAVAASFLTADELRQSPAGELLLKRIPKRVRRLLRDQEKRWWKLWSSC